MITDQDFKDFVFNLNTYGIFITLIPATKYSLIYYYNLKRNIKIKHMNMKSFKYHLLIKS